MLTGSSYFPSLDHAAKYYRDQGSPYDAEMIDRKIKDGEIHIGKPKLKRGQRLRLIDNDTRWAIIEDEKV